MNCVNGMLQLDESERRILEADIGSPLTSCSVPEVLVELERAALRRDAQGNPVWGRMIRRTIGMIEGLRNAGRQTLH